METPLRFRQDGTFTIVQFTDIHWHNGEEADQRTAALMAEILEAEQPDFVAVTGDVIHGSASRDPVASWRNAVAPMVERQIYWAGIFGNHDHEGSQTRAQLMDAQQQMPYSLSQPGPAAVSGVGNYVLGVEASDGMELAAALYFLDSNDYAEETATGENVGGYGWIRRDQIDWYVNSAQALRRLNGGQPLPALAFFHIPLPEYDDLWNWFPCRGRRLEPICCPRINTGFFAAMHQMGDVMATFAGHDHLNDFTGDLYGIRLCFGRAVGFSGYGQQGFARGTRVIRIRQGERGSETWLRLAGGEVVTEQPLHEPMEREICDPGDYG